MKIIKVSVLDIQEKGRGCMVKLLLKEDRKPYVCIFEKEYDGKRLSFAARNSTVEAVLQLPLIIEKHRFKYQADKVFGFIDIIEGMQASYEERLEERRKNKIPTNKRIKLTDDEKRAKVRAYNTEKVREYRAARRRLNHADI